MKHLLIITLWLMTFQLDAGQYAVQLTPREQIRAAHFLRKIDTLPPVETAENPTKVRERAGEIMSWIHNSKLLPGPVKEWLIAYADAKSLGKTLQDLPDRSFPVDFHPKMHSINPLFDPNLCD